MATIFSLTKTLIAGADEQSAVIVHWGNCTTMLITMWYVSAINVLRKPGVAQFWMDWRNDSEKATVVCHERKSSSIQKRLCPLEWSGRAKHNKQTLLSFFGHERERETQPGDFIAKLTGGKPSVENNEGVLPGEGGSDSSLPSQNRLRTYYLCPKHILLVATVGPPAQELEAIYDLIGKSAV